MLFALLVAEADVHGLVLNLSAGASHFKMLRGATAVEEFDAVYDRHLPVHRRIVWSGLAAATRLWAQPLRGRGTNFRS